MIVAVIIIVHISVIVPEDCRSLLYIITIN